MQPAKTVEVQPPSGIEFRRSEGFRNEYANNTFLESTAWDLKVIFGQADLAISPNTVVQHTGITLSWPQVKILLYFLQIHLTVHEVDYGRLTIPKGVIVDVPVPDKETLKQYPNAMQIYKEMCKVHDDFLAANPEAAPAKRSSQ
ncbi:MAG: hypothetical protein WCB94_05515 [Terriglobales bacterium]